MAKLIPDIEAAKASKQKPMPGEIFLLEFLAEHFNDEAEVYFQPCFNGDRPDVVVMDKTRGIIILEVKDWNLQSYSVASRPGTGRPPRGMDAVELSRVAQN